MARNTDDDGESERRDNELRKAPGLTPAERAKVIGADTSKIPDVAPGQNASMLSSPMQPDALDQSHRENIGFKIREETVNLYEIADGTEIRARLVMMRVEKLLGVFNPDGSPVYMCVWNQVTDIVPGPGTRRGEGSA